MKSHRGFMLLLLFLFCLSGCNTIVQQEQAIYPIQNVKNIQDLHSDSFIHQAGPAAFTICHGHTCRIDSRVSLKEA